MKKIKKSKSLNNIENEEEMPKEEVFVYVMYHDIDRGSQTETKIKEYCDRMGYDIEKVYREENYSSVRFGIREVLLQMLGDIHSTTSNSIDLKKVVVYSIEELAEDDYMQLVVVGFIESTLVYVESLKEGVIGEDYILGAYGVPNVKKKKSLFADFNPHILNDDRDWYRNVEESDF